DERHQEAREKRTVWAKEHPDGMAELGVFGPAALVHGAYDRLTEMTKSATTAQKQNTGAGEGLHDETDSYETRADPRTFGQKRADLALDLLLTGAPAGHDTPDGLIAAITATVTVTVPALTLMGATGIESPAAELEGRSPIDPETARMLAGAASGWNRVLTHPVGGAMLAVDRYRPGEQLKRHLRARDQRCRFPGCGMPARNDDLDHTTDAAFGGPTADDNLAALCRRHHVLKHHSPWHVTQRDDGLLEWQSRRTRLHRQTTAPEHRHLHRRQHRRKQRQRRHRRRRHHWRRHRRRRSCERPLGRDARRTPRTLLIAR
ncbi:MAG TPA: HNH endonuclease signature motif containing protein, partial [Microbacterium sp.]|nr:HNH endonuclease signature motif containing protein [Microbacterium sp.]